GTSALTRSSAATRPYRFTRPATLTSTCLSDPAEHREVLRSQVALEDHEEHESREHQDEGGDRGHLELVPDRGAVHVDGQGEDERTPHEQRARELVEGVEEDEERARHESGR